MTKKTSDSYSNYSKLITECQQLNFDREKGYNYTYIPLNEIFKKVKPIIAKHGFILSESCDGDVVMTSLLSSELEFSTKNKIIYDDSKRDPQKYGSAVTYARRYGVQQILCIAPDHDDDGVAARPEKPASQQRVELALKNAADAKAMEGKTASEKQINLIEKLLKDRPTSHTLRYKQLVKEHNGKLPMYEASRMIDALTNIGTK